MKKVEAIYTLKKIPGCNESVNVVFLLNNDSNRIILLYMNGKMKIFRYDSSQNEYEHITNYYFYDQIRHYARFIFHFKEQKNDIAKSNVYKIKKLYKMICGL